MLKDSTAYGGVAMLGKNPGGGVKGKDECLSLTVKGTAHLRHCMAVTGPALFQKACTAHVVKLVYQPMPSSARDNILARDLNEIFAAFLHEELGSRLICAIGATEDAHARAVACIA